MAKATRLLDWRPTIRLAEMLPPIVADYLERYEARVRGSACVRAASGGPGLP
jgi:hypothetical protein